MPDIYRVGVIGCTGRGNYGHGLDTVWGGVPRTKVVAVADPDEAGRTAAQERTGAATAYADYREMLERESLDIAAVAPRWIDQHADMLLAAAERGLHVYMEKPFCRTLEQADQIVRAFEMRHLQLAIAHQSRWSPVLDGVLKELNQGRIGEVLEIRGRGKEDARGGAEDLWVLGSHVFDLMRAIGGDPTRCFGELLQRGRPCTFADVVAEGPEGLGPLAGDALQASYAFPRGVLGSFQSRRGAGSSPSRFGLQIFGSRGVIDMVFGYLAPAWILEDPGWSPGRSGKSWRRLTSQGVDVPETLGPEGLDAGNTAAVNDLLECIENPGRSPRCSLHDARWTLEMIHGVFASHVAGGPVSLPLADRRHALGRAW